MKTLKKHWKWVALAAVIVLLIAIFTTWRPVKNPATQEYIVGSGNCRGQVDTARFLAVDDAFAIGADEDGTPRMVTTPWFETEIPMTQAAELGTKKVMEDHSSIGIVMTTDGTITDIPREDYIDAEQRAITDMKATGKPFIVLVNSEQPDGESAQKLCAALQTRFGVSVMSVNCLSMRVEEIVSILTKLMYEFPVTELRFFLPGWVTALPAGHPLKAALYEAMRREAAGVSRLSEAEPAMRRLTELEQVADFSVRSADLGTGVMSCVLTFPEKLFYDVLSEESGFPVQNDAELLSLLESLAAAKREYDKVASALEQVRATGYGIVMPSAMPRVRTDAMTMAENLFIILFIFFIVFYPPYHMVLSHVLLS